MKVLRGLAGLGLFLSSFAFADELTNRVAVNRIDDQDAAIGILIENPGDAAILSDLLKGELMTGIDDENSLTVLCEPRDGRQVCVVVYSGVNASYRQEHDEETKNYRISPQASAQLQETWARLESHPPGPSCSGTPTCWTKRFRFYATEDGKLELSCTTTLTQNGSERDPFCQVRFNILDVIHGSR